MISFSLDQSASSSCISTKLQEFGHKLQNNLKMFVVGGREVLCFVTLERVIFINPEAVGVNFVAILLRQRDTSNSATFLPFISFLSLSVPEIFTKLDAAKTGTVEMNLNTVS